MTQQPSFLPSVQVDRLSLFQQLERGSPEFQLQDFALARQNVVLHAEPEHGVQVGVDDGIGHYMSDLVGAALDGLDRVQGVFSPL